MTDKYVLRATYTRIRNSLKKRDRLSHSIADKLFDSDEYKSCDTVFAFYSVGSEVETSKIIAGALLDNKNVTLPKCLDKNGSMEFYYIESLSDLKVGMYGILEPTGERIAKSTDCNALCLVPGLAFDRKGYRLGYGGGYYDRFLKNFNGVSIGICFDECLTQDELPHDETDIKVDIIITESEHIKIKEE